MMLALRLGWPSVDRMLASMTTREFVEWQVLDAIDPCIGPERDDLRHAINTTVLANTARNPKRRAFKIEDFIVDFRKQDRRPQTVEQMKASLIRFTKACRGTVK